MLNDNQSNSTEYFKVVKTNIVNGGIAHDEIDFSSINYNGKTIIVLCGNNTKNPIKAGAYSTHCLYWSKQYEDISNVTSYSIFYPSIQPLSNNLIPNPALDYGFLADNLFDPVLYKNGKVQPVNDVINSFGDITFFGHSVGGFVMNELMEKLTTKLRNEHFSEADIQNVYSHITFISYSPFALVEYPIKAIYIAPVYDSVGSTKLVYNHMTSKDNFIASTPNIDTKHICGFNELTNVDFAQTYNNYTNAEDAIYFRNENTLIAVPNLLYFDGISEDHNLAGVIHYNSECPYKTNAGRIATDFCDTVFKYSIETPRENFSTEQLFNQVTNDLHQSQEINQMNKEF